MKIIVDADACPRSVLGICRKAASRLGIPLWTVASFKHRLDADQHIVVGDSPQEADIAIVNAAEEGDVVVTQDWGLAAMVLARGARALSPSGRIFCPETIPFLLEEREIKARFRRGGGRTRGPAKRTPADDRRFGASLYHLLGGDLSPT